MKIILLQTLHSKETRTIRQAAILSDDYLIISLNYEDLTKYADKLLNGALPVGSVEFISKALNIIGIPVPDINPYPVNKYLYRSVLKVAKKDIGDSPVFVKPTKLKQFTGFVYFPNSIELSDEFYIEQDEILKSLPDDTELWTSDPIEFSCEYRYYVQDNKIIGYGRYDAMENDDIPDIKVVEDYVNLLDIDHPYVLDFGISNGQTTLVEYNDAWAIGLYEDALSPEKYLKFLEKRWQSFI